MRRLRARRSLVVLGLALFVFATFLPSVSSALPDVILTALWLVVPAVAVIVVRRAAARCHARSLALVSLARFRAPPVTLDLA
jgi:hypothetical protein